jgi:hypothetical protein
MIQVCKTQENIKSTYFKYVSKYLPVTAKQWMQMYWAQFD